MPQPHIVSDSIDARKVNGVPIAKQLGTFNLQKERVAEKEFTKFTLRFIAIHLLLGVVFHYVPLLTFVHSIGAFLLGLKWVREGKPPEYVAYIAAYITGSEILWRMMMAAPVWEFGKYSIALLAFMNLWKRGYVVKSNKVAMTYFLLLVPASVDAISREYISYTLSGPFALAVSAMFFSTITLRKSHARVLLVSLLTPVVTAGMNVVVGVATSDVEVLTFSTMELASGGLKGNQVSSAFGMGAFAAFLITLLLRKWSMLHIIMNGLMVGLLIQAALTFSRGGVFSAAVAIFLCMFFLASAKGNRFRVLLKGGFLVLVFLNFMLPFLDDITGGAIIERYAPTDRNKQKNYLTGRDKHIEAELQAFEDNPLLGAGIGGSKEYRYNRGSSHTEFSRLIGEHGLLGILALFLLLWMAVSKTLKRSKPIERAFSISLIAWSFSYTFHQAMRLVAPSFLFGLGMANFDFSDEEKEKAGEVRQTTPKPVKRFI